VATSYKGLSVNKVDGKGRVSVPSGFRDVAQVRMPQSRELLIAVNAEARCLDGYDATYTDKQQAALAQEFGDSQSPERDRKALAMFGLVHPVSFDETGRIVIPELYLKVAGIKGHAAFIAAGDKFQIWNPGRLLAHLGDARAIYEPFLVDYVDG